MDIDRELEYADEYHELYMLGLLPGQETKEEIKNLKNQVITLTNNNEELKRRLKLVQQKRDTHKAVRYRLQNKIDKAMEYIKNNYMYDYADTDDLKLENQFFGKDLLKILKGGNND